MENSLKKLLKTLEEQAQLFEAVASELHESKNRIQALIYGSESISQAIELPIHKKEKSNNFKKGSISVASLVRRFLKEYQKEGTPFTKEILNKRVKGLMKEATDSSIYQAQVAWAKKYNTKLESQVINGKEMLVIASIDQ
jgi:hypothetical protein